LLVVLLLYIFQPLTTTKSSVKYFLQQIFTCLYHYF